MTRCPSSCPSSWPSSWPERIQRGLAMFDRGEYFEAHEVLEDEWRETAGELRLLYQGLIQTAVTFYQLQRSNPGGALKMARAAREKLTPFIDDVPALPLARAVEQLAEIETALAGGTLPDAAPAFAFALEADERG